MQNKIYFINVRTLKIREDDGTEPLPYEFGKIAEGIKQFIELFVQWVESKGSMHKTFNTSAKKDVVKFILDKQ